MAEIRQKSNEYCKCSNLFVYRIKDNIIEISQCRGHYDNK